MEKILEYLKKDEVNNIDFIIAIKMGGEVIFFQKEGLLIRSVDNIYLLSCTDIDVGNQWLATVSNPKLFVVHQQEYIESIEKLFPLRKQMVVNQAVYINNKIHVESKSDVKICKLDITNYEEVKQNYSTELEDEYLRKQLQQPYFYGAYIARKLVGFIGLHEEMSIGFLEVFPNYQGKGIALYLESYLMERLLNDGIVPYAQIKVGNEPSLKLHQKLGFTIGDKKIYWLT